jgi:WD40 repeat protein
MDLATCKVLATHELPWAVNYTAVRPSSGPGGRIMALVGDDTAAVLLDVASGRKVAELHGHMDYSFAVAWHPDGNLFATGNQDTTSLVWDVRCLRQPLHMLRGEMSAIRSLRWSPDGRFLAMAEPADFVHVFDVQQGFAQAQVVDLFGEVAGVSFTPDSDALFVSVSDMTYASLMQFDRAGAEALVQPEWR